MKNSVTQFGWRGPFVAMDPIFPSLDLDLIFLRLDQDLIFPSFHLYLDLIFPRLDPDLEQIISSFLSFPMPS